MNKNKILVVDDEEDILELIKYNLELENYEVISASSGEECLKKVTEYKLDLIVLDLMLPGISGLEVCKKLKIESETLDIPIIMLTAKSTESDIVLGLELGADDYITKPFSPKVLTARIKSVLRRSKIPDDQAQIISRYGFKINITGREVSYNGKLINLTYSEFEILRLFISHPGRVYSRLQIMQTARDDNYIVTERAIDVQIVNLRKKMMDGGVYIKTVRGVGYKFQA
jgi:two-component system phosphate regulon response regulator PhoB